MCGQGKRLFGYRNTALLYHERVSEAAAGEDGEGYAIERFGLGDNLMIDCAILESGGSISAVPEASLAALAAFRQVLRAVWQQIHGAAIG
jgi:hypothetical protein